MFFAITSCILHLYFIDGCWSVFPLFACWLVESISFPICLSVPGGLSAVKDGTPGGGRQGGGGQEEGLVCPGAEDQEGGGGLPLRLHQGPGEGPGPASTLGPRREKLIEEQEQEQRSYYY